MSKTILVLGAAAVALSTVPAEGRHYSNVIKCAKYRHGRCVQWNRLTRHQARKEAYRVGYVFGPSYAYVPVSQLPPPIVTQYDLTPDYRYVYRDHYVYVVDPKTYAITRVIDALTR
jgi:hypothetical protein